mmetsp:Transcript_25622/g.55110  ORF Transcript_25622/g.55110 Transcript_25622/m.55110 type:complete len:203 (+) Transcript_25622:1194-1802(+)
MTTTATILSHPTQPHPHANDNAAYQNVEKATVNTNTYRMDYQYSRIHVPACGQAHTMPMPRVRIGIQVWSISCCVLPRLRGRRATMVGRRRAIIMGTIMEGLPVEGPNRGAVAVMEASCPRGPTTLRRILQSRAVPRQDRLRLPTRPRNPQTTTPKTKTMRTTLLSYASPSGLSSTATAEDAWQPTLPKYSYPTLPRVSHAR